jgi:hypothetical protein
MSLFIYLFIYLFNEFIYLMYLFILYISNLLLFHLLRLERHRVRIEEMVDKEKALNREKLNKALAREEIIDQVFSKSKVTAVRTLGPI